MNPLTATAAADGRAADSSRPATVERFVPERMGGRLIHSEHVARYAWAATLAPGKIVLDAGCGVGYGARMLLQAGARRVAGIDASSEAIAEAATLAPEVEFRVGDLLHRLPFADDSFDLVVCFEVIEHLADPATAIGELRRVLRPGGLALASTPNVDVHPAGNEHHVGELRPDQLKRLMCGSFPHVRLERQHMWAASLIGSDAVLAAEDPMTPTGATVRKVSARAPGRETFTLAVASVCPLPEVEPVAVLVDTYEVGLWQDRLDELRGEVRKAYQQLETTRARLELDDLNARRMATAFEQLSSENAELRETAKEAAKAASYVAELERAVYWLRVIEGSASWRFTRPFRVLMRVIRRIGRRTDPSALNAPR